MKGWLRRRAVFLLVLAALAGRFLLVAVLHNENEVLPMAKQAFDPGWIPNDWFFGLAVGNRYTRLLFDFAAGWAASFLSLGLLAHAGRALIYVLFAGLMQELADLFACPAAFLLPFFAFFLRHQSLVAREWILGGFEEKSFAYFFAFAALAAVLRRRYARAWLLQGLAISLHVLVGAYSAGCLAAALVLNRRRLGAEAGKALRAAPWLLATSVFVWPALYARWAANRGVDAAAAARVYVLYRVPHHLFPAAWKPGPWPLILMLAVAGLAVLYRRSKDARLTLAAAYAGVSALYFLVGLAAFAAGNVPLLRYYWFRFPDAAIPFWGCLLLAVLASRRLDALPRARARAPRAAAMAATAVLTVLALAAPATTSEDSPLPPGRELADALRWIRGSTPRGSRVLASPFIETFYQEAERAQLVSFKYIPQSEGDMLQWYERLKACNGGRDPRSAGFASRGEVEASFYGLSEDELRALAKRYGMSYYLGRQDHPKSLPALYSNAEYALYAL